MKNINRRNFLNILSLTLAGLVSAPIFKISEALLPRKSFALENPESPLSFNWADYKGYDWTTPAKDNGTCAACHTFAPVGAIESVLKISSLRLNIEQF